MGCASPEGSPQFFPLATEHSVKLYDKAETKNDSIFSLTLIFVQQLEQIKSTLLANHPPSPRTSEGHQTPHVWISRRILGGSFEKILTSNGNYEKEC